MRQRALFFVDEEDRKEVLAIAMGKQGTNGSQPLRIVRDNPEEWVRRKAQEFIQSSLEEEVTELLGRRKSERRHVDSPPAYRNAHGKARWLTLGRGTVTVYRPRVRKQEQRFESRALPMFARRTVEVNKLIPQLYLHGLAPGDFDPALRGLLGEEAPVSACTVARFEEGWQKERGLSCPRLVADGNLWHLGRLEQRLFRPRICKHEG